MEINDTPINPINLILRSSSYSRTNDILQTKYNLTFDLYKPIKCYDNCDIFISLDSFQFTNSFYTINENNSIFCYKLDTSSLPITTILTYGNYDIDSLLVLLNTTFLNIFVFTYSEITMKITITSTNYFKLIDNGINKNIYEVLGFNDLGTTTFALSCTSQYVVNLMSVQQLNITTDLNLDSVGLKASSHYNVLNTIQVTCKPQEVQTFKNNTMFKYRLNDKVINSITLTVFNQDYLPINFNNIDWFASILFTFSYNKAFIPTNNYLTVDSHSLMQFELMREERRLFLEEIEKYNTDKKNI